MNIRPNMPVALPPLVDTVERRLWTVEDLRRLEHAGILHHDERVELIAGEIVRMAPKGARHEVVRNELILLLSDRRPRDVKFAEEPPLTLDDHYEPEPDIILFPATLRVNEVRGETVLLVVEIADSSFKWDAGTKAKVYAAFGVREYWVINARTLETLVHREPGKEGYGTIETVLASNPLRPSLVPSLAVCLAELDLG